MNLSFSLRNIILLSILTISLSVLLIRCKPGRVPVERVVLIGIDGLGVSGFQEARTPNIDALVRDGALSLETRSVMPTVSAPNWGSHLLGAGPEQHGITYNGWTVDNHTIEPVISDPDGYFPSIFNLLRDQRPEARMGFFYDWDALADIYNVSLIDKVEYSKHYDSTITRATSWIIENNPEFTFLYIGYPDEMGHRHQWGSRAYIQAIEEVDAALGRLFENLRAADMYESSHFIVVSDHGGVGYSHGGLSMEEIQTPWIISGPGILQDRLINQPNNVVNTAATIAHLFQLTVPYAWTGRPVLGAFQNDPMARENTSAYVPQPKPSILSGLYDESQAIAFTVSDPKVKIRYTLDGRDPGPESPVYKSPVLLQKTSILKAAGSLDDHMSKVALVDFVKVLKVQRIRLTHLPDEKYPANGEWSLVDRQTASSKYTDGNWLGFRGTDVEAFITLDERRDVTRFSLGFLNNPGSWIFPPESIRVLASVDGTAYSEIGRLGPEDLQARLRNGRNEVRVQISPAFTKYLKIEVGNAGVCPPGHPGAGEPAWLFVDECIFE